MAYYKSVPQMEEEIHNGKDEVNESRGGSTLRIRYERNRVPVAIDVDAGVSYTIDGRDVGRNGAIEWMNSTARMFVTSRNGFPESFCGAIDNAMKMFETLDSLYSTSNMKLVIRQGMIREAVSDLVYVHNALQNMTKIGEELPEVTDETPLIGPSSLHNLLKTKYLHQEATFIKGAVSDPFIYASSEQPGLQIGTDMQQHAVLNLRKAQHVLAGRLEQLLSEDRHY